MAKRFTSTEKWIDPWFCGLSPICKLFWVYLLDNCDHAGIWQVNWPLVKFHIWEEKVDPTLYGNRIVVINESKWFIPKFIEFQYGELVDTNNTHRSVIKILEKQGILRGSIAPPQGDLDKDKGKVQVIKDDVVNEEYDLSWPISYLNQLLGTRYSPTIKSNLDVVKARYSEGRTQNDFKTVIDKKVAQWRSDEKMAKYLRPETLFNRTKFESYLNELGKAQETSKFWPKHHKSCNECFGNGYIIAPGSGLRFACREKFSEAK